MSTSTDRDAVATKPPAELVSFVQRQIRDKPHGHGIDRRLEQRHEMLVPVLVQPVDEEFHPVGTPFACVTRDISAKGIGLVHSEPFDDRLLGLQLSLAGEEVNVVVKVQWSSHLGPFYYAGGEFVARLESFPRARHEMLGVAG